MLRRRKFQPSETYGKPHPGIPEAQECALFCQSVYDAAPTYIRLRTHDDGNALWEWFYSLEKDPRPFNERYGIPPDMEEDLPSFPWDRPYGFMVFQELFG